MSTHRVIRPVSAAGIATLAAVSLQAVVAASREGGPGSTAPALTTPAVDAKEPTDASAASASSSASASSALPESALATAMSRSWPSPSEANPPPGPLRTASPASGNVRTRRSSAAKRSKTTLTNAPSPATYRSAFSRPYASCSARASETAGLRPVTAERAVASATVTSDTWDAGARK